ncbi:hypothetical protein QBC42DRAFT_287713 [Cladorrhinum samala]|uniref:Uncharacterized protein n=1 Tax=Cladorrhinum samala TaxID=585594 RepID=A0AAV9HK11_9PEZI|nr:hypothetical protein QBC42DRAFT_287713 [Cladorrhinum samala]
MANSRKRAHLAKRKKDVLGLRRRLDAKQTKMVRRYGKTTQTPARKSAAAVLKSRTTSKRPAISSESSAESTHLEAQARTHPLSNSTRKPASGFAINKPRSPHPRAAVRSSIFQLTGKGSQGQEERQTHEKPLKGPTRQWITDIWKINNPNHDSSKPAPDHGIFAVALVRSPEWMDLTTSERLSKSQRFIDPALRLVKANAGPTGRELRVCFSSDADIDSLRLWERFFDLANRIRDWRQRLDIELVPLDKYLSEQLHKNWAKAVAKHFD